MKKDNKFQITMPELQQIIKEEYASMAKELKEKAEKAEGIQARLDAINEELETLPETLSEVEAGGLKGVKSTGWTGAGESDKKYDEKFETIGTHLKEDEEFEGEVEVGGEEMEGPEMGGEMEGPEMGYFEAKFAELGKELDAKVGGGEEESMEDSEMAAPEMAAPEMEGMAMNEEVVEEDAEVVAEEVVEEGVEVVAEEVVEEDAEIVSEDLEEPIEGSTPAQDQKARFNDYMEKDTHVKEGVSKANTTLLSEGFTPEKKSSLDKELERMKRLAKI